MSVENRAMGLPRFNQRNMAETKMCAFDGTRVPVRCWDVWRRENSIIRAFGRYKFTRIVW